jgi:O-acetyl-ADP-ribose deacetylase (regulator of RNase III)
VTRARTYKFGESELTIRFGDITGSNAQVLVSSDDCYISMGGGVSAALLRAGGEGIALDAAKKVPAALGDIVVTSAGKLTAQYIFHAITIGPNPGKLSKRDIVERLTRRCMQLLANLQLTSIAFPAIGAGVAGLSYDDVAVCMAEVISGELAKRRSAIEATIFLFDRFSHMEDLDFLRFFEEFASHAPGIAKNFVHEASVELTPRITCVDMAAETAEDYKRRRIHNLRKLLASLEDQRVQLEETLIATLVDGRGSEESKVRQALHENQELRLQYLGELHSYIAADPGTQKDVAVLPLSVFVSSTYKDLADCRHAVKDAISKCDLFFRGMEHFGADSDRLPAASLIVAEVRKADVYLGIFGVRYGSIDPVTGLSMTELEFREAETSKKLCDS